MANQRRFIMSADLLVAPDGALVVRAGLGLLAGPHEVTVGIANKTLSELLTAAGKSIHADLAVLSLIVASDGVYWANGAAAVANTNPLPKGVNELCCTAQQAQALQFITVTGNIKMSVVQEG